LEGVVFTPFGFCRTILNVKFESILSRACPHCGGASGCRHGRHGKIGKSNKVEIGEDSGLHCLFKFFFFLGFTPECFNLAVGEFGSRGKGVIE
jgi:hypothetical protein